jgi:hypothetical protein
VVSFPCLWPGPDRRAVPGPVPVPGPAAPPRRPGAGPAGPLSESMSMCQLVAAPGGHCQWQWPRQRRGEAGHSALSLLVGGSRQHARQRDGAAWAPSMGQSGAAALSVRPSADGDPA